MEYIIGLLLFVVGFLYNKNNKERAAAKMAETKARDQVLKEQAEETKAQITTLDANIKKMKDQRELEAKKRKDDNLSLKERAERIKKGLK
jgi:cell division protein FtsB